MENFTPYTALAGGTLIGVAVTLFLLFNGRMTGISGIMNGLITANRSDWFWRLSFLTGLILGAFLFHQIWPEAVSLRENYSIWLLTIGGFFIGIGTRLSSGCTSGHGICGIANLSMRSIVATVTFMMSGIITVYVIRHILGISS